MLDLGEADLRDQIRSLGLFRNEARHVIALSRKLVDDHGGEVSKDRDALLALSGAGPKTADVILNTLFGEPAIAVDTHVLRVCNRTQLAPGTTPDQIAAALKEVTPAQ